MVVLLNAQPCKASEASPVENNVPPRTELNPENKSYDSLLLGHNLTPTSYTLEKNSVVLGLYYIGYGVTDNFMVATSPWMLGLYNMPMLDFKLGFFPPLFDHASVELMYFKTAEFLLNDFHQNSTWFRLTTTSEFGKNYRLHVCLGIQYFFDDLLAFSMRPPPTNNTPLTISFSTLQEIHFSQHWGTFLESGFLGINYPNRYLHLGLSGFYQWSRGYLQLGLSKTIPIGPDYLGNHPNDSPYWKNGNGDFVDSVYYGDPSPIHPEIHLEFLL